MNRTLLLMATAGTMLLQAETRLGQPMTLRQPLSVDQVIAAADTSVGKTIQVKGKVTEVCQKRKGPDPAAPCRTGTRFWRSRVGLRFARVPQMAGCWMQLAGTGSNAIRIRVNDGDIVFPRTAVGKTAIAEGKLRTIELTREQAVDRAKHEADERGVKFNPASVKAGSTFYQIQGTGALILE